jgi:opacity protein-like surface antigen
MNIKKLIVAALAVAALASSSLAAAADAPKLQIGPSVVKVANGKLVLTAKCIGTAECQSVLTARIDVKNGGLGGQIFDVEPGQTEKLVFKLEPNVRAWLRTHRRSTLVISARTSNEEYEVVWRGTFRLQLHA